MSLTESEDLTRIDVAFERQHITNQLLSNPMLEQPPLKLTRDYRIRHLARGVAAMIENEIIKQVGAL